MSDTKKSQKVVRLLSSERLNKLIKHSLKDLASDKASLAPSTILEGALFVLSSPKLVKSIVKLATASDILTPDFQHNLLDKEQVWDFLQKKADDLPKIGKILANQNYREFSKGNILDEQSLEILKDVFKNKKTLLTIKEIALESRKAEPDWTKISTKTLEMLVQNKEFTDFFKVKGESLANYLEHAATKVTAGDYNKTIDNFFSKQPKKSKYDAIKTLLKNQSLKDQILDNPAESVNLPKIQSLPKEQQTNYREFIDDIINNTKSPLAESFTSYNIDNKVIDIVPELLDNIPQIKNIFDSLNSQGVMEAVEKSLDMIISDNHLTGFFKQNKDFLPNLATGIIENTPNVLEITKDYKFDLEILEIAGAVMSRPKLAKEIIHDFNQQDYLGVASTLIVSLNDPKLNLRSTLQDLSMKGLFDNLIQGVIEQDEKSVIIAGGDISKTIKNSLKTYDIDSNNISQMNSIFPLLIDDPKSLQKIFGSFVTGEYPTMAKDILILAEQNSSVKDYFHENRDLFVKVVNKVIENTPTLKSLNLQGEIYDIVPQILEHPKDLIKIIEGYEKGNYKDMLTGIIGFTKNTNALSLAVPSVKFGFNTLKELGSNLLSNLQGGDNKKQLIIDDILQELKEKPATEKIKLQEFVNMQIEISEFSNTTDSKYFKDLTIKNDLFNNISIKGTASSPLKLENIEVQNINFTNSKIAHTSFKNSQFINASFAGAKFLNVDFNEATIDSATFKTLIPSLKTGELNLQGAKLVGDFSGLDLANISLVKVDLSGITALKSTNLNNTNLRDAVLPKNNILIEADNLQRAHLDFAPELVIIWEDKLIDKAINKIYLHSKLNGKQVNHNKEEITNIIKDLCNTNPEINNYLIDKLSISAIDAANNFPIKPEKLKNTDDLFHSPNLALANLYENINNANDIKITAIADIISEKVSKQLFPVHAQNNHGQEAYNVKQMVSLSIKEIQKENPNIDTSLLLSNKFSQKLIDDVADSIKPKFQYTITRAAYLPQEIFDDNLHNNIKAKFATNIKSIGSTKAISHEINESTLNQAKQIMQQMGGNITTSPNNISPLAPPRIKNTKKIAEYQR